MRIICQEITKLGYRRLGNLPELIEFPFPRVLYTNAWASYICSPPLPKPINPTKTSPQVRSIKSCIRVPAPVLHLTGMKIYITERSLELWLRGFIPVCRKPVALSAVSLLCQEFSQNGLGRPLLISGVILQLYSPFNATLSDTWLCVVCKHSRENSLSVYSYSSNWHQPTLWTFAIFYHFEDGFIVPFGPMRQLCRLFT